MTKPEPFKAEDYLDSPEMIAAYVAEIDAELNASASDRETAHLLRSKANAIALLESMKQANRGQFIEYDPNAETIAALKEVEAGGGEVFHGSTAGVFKKLLEE